MNPLMTVTLSVHENGELFSDVQTHDRSFAEVHAAMIVARDELIRIVNEQVKCPFYPKSDADWDKKIHRKRTEEVL